MRVVPWLGALVIALAGCSTAATASPQANPAGMGMGMMERHHAQIPQEYAGLNSPIPAEDESFSRGAQSYAMHCASCHGDGGMGDGPAGAALDPAPAAIAHTSQMMGDDYLFWRISEGSGGFNTAMPAWKDVLDERARWDVINYVRALGEGNAQPASEMGGAVFDAQVQATQQAAILAQAVEQGVITQAEADTFNRVHTALEQFRSEHSDEIPRSGNATEQETAVLAKLVESQAITQADADAFRDIHDRLGASGLMP